MQKPTVTHGINTGNHPSKSGMSINKVDQNTKRLKEYNDSYLTPRERESNKIFGQLMTFQMQAQKMPKIPAGIQYQEPFTF